MQQEADVNISLTLSDTTDISCTSTAALPPSRNQAHDDEHSRMQPKGEKDSRDSDADETAQENVAPASSLESDGNVRRKMWKTKAEKTTAPAPSSSSATLGSEKIEVASSSSTHNNQNGNKQPEKGDTAVADADTPDCCLPEGAAISCKNSEKGKPGELSCQREGKENQRETNQESSEEKKTERAVAAEEHLPANETNASPKKSKPDSHECRSPIPRVDTTASFDLCENSMIGISSPSALVSPTTCTSSGGHKGDNNKNGTEKNGEFAISGFPFISDVRYNPQKKDKYKVNDEYEDLADVINIAQQPSDHGHVSAASSRGEHNDKEKKDKGSALNPKEDCVGGNNENGQKSAIKSIDSQSTSSNTDHNPQNPSTSSDTQQRVEVPSSPRGAHNACGGARGGLKSQLMSPNATHHTNATIAGGAFSSSTAGTSSVVSEDFTIQIAKTRQEGKEARKAHHHHHDRHGSSLENRATNRNDEQQRDRSVIVTDKRAAVGADVDATRSSSIPQSYAGGTSDELRISETRCSNNISATEKVKREEVSVSSSAVLSPNSEPAQRQLFVSMCNPNSLLGDYIPLPEDSIVPLAFRVVKKHHRMSWLKQSRIIIVTGSDLRNCKEDGAGSNGDTSKPKKGGADEDEDTMDGKIGNSNDNSLLATMDASATKIIPFSSITRLSLTSKTSFAIHVLGDHTYYYISDHSLEIVWAIRKRMSICAAIAKLVRGTTAGTDQLRQLARAFMVDELTLPQFSAGADFFATGGAHDEFGESSKKEKKSRSASGLDSVFTNDKAAAEALRYATNMKNRMAIIDAVKNEILPNESRRLKKLIDTCSSVNVLQRQSISLRHIRTVIDEVRDSISELLANPDARTKQQSKVLPDIYDVSAARAVSDEAIQTVLLTSIHGNIWASLHLQHDLVELESQFRQQCRFLRSEVAPQELGVPESCLNFHYDLVLETIRKIATAKTPHVMMEEITACCKSIVLTIVAGSEYGFTRADLPISVPPLCSPSCSADAPPLSSNSVDAGKKKADENNINNKKQTALAADDILPILIYLIVHSNVNDLVYVREYVNNLGDPEEASERSYYYTMFASAIEYVLASTEEVKRMREHNANQEEKEERRRKRREEIAKKSEERKEKKAREHNGNAKERAGNEQKEEDELQANGEHNNEEEDKEESAEAVGATHRRKSLFEDNAVMDRSDDEDLHQLDKDLSKPHPKEKDNSSVSSQHLVLSRGGSKGHFKTVSCSESFGKVVVDPTPIAEIIAKMEEKDAERERILSSLAYDAVGAVILGFKDNDDDDKSNRTSSVKNDSILESYTRSRNHMECAQSTSTEIMKSSFSSSSPTSSTPFSSSGNSPTPRDQHENMFLSPFSAFVQNDVTLHFKRQALIRHQNNTNYNKKATSASSPYAIHNLLKSNPANINLSLFDRYKTNTNKNSVQQQENKSSLLVDAKDSHTGDTNGSAEERGNKKPYFLQR